MVGNYGSIKQRTIETHSKGQGHGIDWLNIKLTGSCVCVFYVPPETVCTMQGGKKRILKI